MNLEDAGFTVRTVADAETRADAHQRMRSRTRAARLDAARHVRARAGASAAQRRAHARAARSSWSPRAARKATGWRGSRRGSTITSPSRSRRASSRRASSPCCAGARRRPRRRRSPLGPLCRRPGHPSRHRQRRSHRRSARRSFACSSSSSPVPSACTAATQLLDQVWGDHVYIEERTVDVHIRRLRLALEPCGSTGMVETVRGSGYRLAAPKQN